MLYQFIAENREELVELVRLRARERRSPADEVTFLRGVPVFLDQLTGALAQPLDADADAALRRQIIDGAALHGHELSKHGLTASQVVHGYGDICQAVTELANSKHAPISAREFQLFNRCLDDAIAGAVTAYGERRERNLTTDDTERLGVFAHELRNLLNTATLAFDFMKRGVVGLNGSTGMVLRRSLNGMRILVDRSLTVARLDAQMTQLEPTDLASFLEELSSSAELDANVRGIRLSVDKVEPGTVLYVDHQSLMTAATNLLQNAFKYTRVGGQVLLKARISTDRVQLEVHDECGGLPPGAAEMMFDPFTRVGSDSTGLGLGLGIARNAILANHGTLGVHNVPGVGCVFTIDLPRSAPSAEAKPD